MIEKKRITQISLGDGYAGSAKFAILSSAAFARMGHDVQVVVSESSLTEKRARDMGLLTATLSVENEALQLATLKKNLDQFRPEFVIAHHSRERKFLMQLRRQEGRKFFAIAFRNIVSRSFPIFSSIPYNLWLDLNVACGKGVARSLIVRGILPSKVRVVYNGIEPYSGNIKPIQKSELGCDADCHIIGMSAWFHPKRKGFDILFKALSQGLPLPYKIMFLGIVDEHRAQVQQMAQRYGIEPNAFIFPGYVENTWRYYQAMDVFVLPSREEGFSLSLLEAMTCRLPCIASNIPGNNEAIQHDVTGKLFPIHRPNLLRDALIELLTDSSKAARIGEAACQRVLNNFTIEKVTESFDRVLGELK
ncbi:MAG: glycosyltransferase family 4 protein [Candidatus Zhuqueibacterota bacterium]